MKKIINSHIAHLLIAILIVVVGWQIVGDLKVSFMIPPFTEVIKTLVSMLVSGKLTQNLIFSMKSLAEGFILAVTTGSILGILTGRYSLIDELTSIYIGAFMSSPMAAFIPILILLFGLGRSSVVATVFMFSFFVMVVNARTGVRNIDPNLTEMAKSFGANELKLLRYIIIPGALPEIMTGVRLAIGRAVRGLVVGEMLITLSGIGGMLETYGNSYNVNYLYAVVLAIMGIAILLTEGIHLLDTWLIGWRRNTGIGSRNHS